MPFAPKINQDQAGQAPEAGQAAPKLSGVSTSFNVPGSGQAQTPGAAKTQKSSGQFQNIEKYIQANQPQGQELGQKIAQNVESKVGESSAQLQKMSTALPSTSQYKPEETIGKAESLQAPEIAAYKQMKSTGGYTGPQDITGLAGYNEAFKASEAAKEAVSKASGEAGQQALLQETFARPDYTKGSNILDQIILAGSQGGKQAITDVGEKYKGLSDYLSNQFGVSQKQIEASQAQAQANKEAIAQAEKKAMEDLINPLQAIAEKRNIEYPELQKRILSDVKDYNLTPESLSGLGLNVGQNIYNLDLSNYITPNQTPQTINSVASDWQRQKYQALSNLFDQNAGLLSATNPNPDFTPIAFNKEQLSKDILTKKKEFEDFAKNRQYNQTFNYGGGRSLSDWQRLMGESDKWNATGSVNATLQDYLNKGENALNYGNLDPTMGRGDYYSQAEIKRQEILNQIKQDLENYGYYNKIGEA
jgi:hypothetical protein